MEKVKNIGIDKKGLARFGVKPIRKEANMRKNDKKTQEKSEEVIKEAIIEIKKATRSYEKAKGAI